MLTSMSRSIECIKLIVRTQLLTHFAIGHPSEFLPSLAVKLTFSILNSEPVTSNLKEIIGHFQIHVYQI